MTFFQRVNMQMREIYFCSRMPLIGQYLALAVIKDSIAIPSGRYLVFTKSWSVFLCNLYDHVVHTNFSVKLGLRRNLEDNGFVITNE